MQLPLVSVLISTFNNEKTIKEAVNSVLNQSYENIEILIVEDFSSDKTLQQLQEYTSNPKIKIISNKNNIGAANSRNQIAKLAKGKYFAIQDGDDVWINNDKLNKQVEFLEKNIDHVVVGAWGIITDNKLNHLYSVKLPAIDKDIRDRILFEGCFLHSVTLISAKAFNTIGGYNEKLNSALDYDLFMRLGIVGKFANIPENMLLYRHNPNGIGNTKSIEQLNNCLLTARTYKRFYPGYFSAFLIWKARKYYPSWMKGRYSWFFKNMFRSRFAINI